MESRRAFRYPVVLECVVSRFVEPVVKLSGRTLNMSRRGLLALFPLDETQRAVLGVGEFARLVVELVPQVPNLRGCCLHCTCHVARVDRRAGTLIAFDFEHYELRPSAPC